VDTARLESILVESRWLARPTGEPGAYASAFAAGGVTFNARVRLGDDRLEVVVAPYLPAPPAERAAALYERLLAVNAKIVMARFALDEDGTVLLCVDWPRANLDDSEVRDALDAASYYAERHHAELSEIAS
jgi:hypothetical protein